MPLKGHKATAVRRRAGEQPYIPTEPRTGGLAPPAEKLLPTHLQSGGTVRLSPIYRILCKDTPVFSCPSGCSFASTLPPVEADLLVVEELSDMDLKVEQDPKFVAWQVES